MNDHLPFFRLPSKHTPLRPDDDDDDTTPLISPMSRIHTAAAHHKRRKRSTTLRSPRRSVSPQKLLPIQFILVPTMLTRKTKRNFELGGRDRDTPLELQRLSPPRSSTSTSTTRSPEVRSDMLVALIPRTPLEKLLHRRATWLQRWWRRMCNNLWYVRATVLQSYFRMFLGKLHRIFLIEQRIQCKLLYIRIRKKFVRKILRGWRRIKAARIFGVRIRCGTYHVWLLDHVISVWRKVTEEAKAKHLKTIFFFQKWMKNRMQWCYYKVWLEFVRLRIECRRLCKLKNFRTWKIYVAMANQSKHAAIARGRSLLENSSAEKIQKIWYEYTLWLTLFAGGGGASAGVELTLEEIHAHATTIQAAIARGPQGRVRHQAFGAAEYVLQRVLMSVHRMCVHHFRKRMHEKKIFFEIERAKREREFLAECDCMCLQTQKKWEESEMGAEDMLRAIVLMESEGEYLCMLDGRQRSEYLKVEGLRRARRERRNRTSRRAVVEFRKVDPPSFGCEKCGSPFAMVEEFNGHGCVLRGEVEEMEEGEGNVLCSFRETRLSVELEKMSASELFEAMVVGGEEE